MGKEISGYEQIDVTWRRCSEQGLRAASGVHSPCSLWGGPWCKSSTLNAARTHSVLAFNMKTKNLWSNYCEHADPALIPPQGPLRAQP